MRAYVGSAFANKEAVRAAQAALIAAGHTVTHDWTPEDAGTRTGAELDAYQQACGWDDVHGVERAEVVVALNHVAACGLWWECGIALGRRIPVIVVGPGKWTIFMDLPGVYRVHTVEDAIALIASLEKRSTPCAR